MLLTPIVGDIMHTVLVFSYDVTVGITLGTKSVKLIWKGCDIKSSTCRPCGRIKISSWRKMDRVKNPMGLMHIGGCVSPFNGVSLMLVVFSFFHLASGYSTSLFFFL